MKRLLIVLILLLQCSLVFASSGKPPAPTETNIAAKTLTKSYAKKIVTKAQEISYELRTGVRTDERGALEDFIAWLKLEFGEAFDTGADYSKFVSAAKIVFSNACSHDEKLYRKSWQNFLGIALKYSAFVACSFVEPVFLPVGCFVVGSILGRAAGDGIGKLIHDGCGRELSLHEITRETDKIIDEIDPFKEDEYREFIKEFGY